MRRFSRAPACTVWAAIRNGRHSGTGAPASSVSARLRLRSAAQEWSRHPRPADHKEQGRAAEARVSREERRTEKNPNTDIVFAEAPPPTPLRAAIRDSY